MKNIFDVKLNKSVYFDKPQEFILVKCSAGQVTLRKKETYAVWQKKRRIQGKLVNVFWLQSEYHRGTRHFDFFHKVNDVCMTIDEALQLSKMKRLNYAEQRIFELKKLIKVNEVYLQDSNNFTAHVESKEFKSFYSKSVKFPILKEIRSTFE
tara:strand:+ start:47 stop:502 length:456 start_codon:yes stop_codon:yes gene_type:complete